MNSLVSTFLVGMLLASIGLNAYQWKDSFCAEPPQGDNTMTETGDATPASLDVQQLKLSEEQQTALSSCGNGCACAAMALREDVRVATVALQEACANPEIDATELERLATALCALREREVTEHVAAMLSVREVLGPDQLKELHEIACKKDPQ
jgi:Spy/CpxP family protein refolding chaperone